MSFKTLASLQSGSQFAQPFGQTVSIPQEESHGFKLRVPGYLRLWEWFSLVSSIASDLSCESQYAKNLLAPARLHGSARPFFFSIHTILLIVVLRIAIILASITLIASYSLLSSPPVSSSTSYSSLLSCYRPRHRILIGSVVVTSYCTTSHCLRHSRSCANNAAKLSDLLAASYSPSYSSRLTRCRPRRRRYPYRHCTRRVFLATLLAGSILTGSLFDIVLITSYCTTSHCLSRWSAMLTMLPCSPSYLPRRTRYHTRRVLLAILLVASHSLSLLPASSSLSSPY
jgi:hypothetical protein